MILPGQGDASVARLGMELHRDPAAAMIEGAMGHAGTRRQHPRPPGRRRHMFGIGEMKDRAPREAGEQVMELPGAPSMEM